MCNLNQMKYLNICLLIFFFGLGASAYSQTNHSMTYKLVTDFHNAWNDEDLKRMEELLDKDAFFKSPFQLRYSRDTMMTTVLLRNPKVYKVTEIIETRSMIKDHLAWSIGSMVSDIYDEKGRNTGKKWHNDYVYLFVLDKNGEWKLQMLLYHE